MRSSLARYDDVLGERLEANTVFLHNRNGDVPSLAGVDIPDRAGLAGVRAANDLALSAINELTW